MAIIITTDLADEYAKFKNQARRFDERVEDHIATMAAGDVDSDAIVGLFRYLKGVKDRLQYYSGVVGLDTQAQDEENDPTYDLFAEITSVITAIDSTMAWIDTNFPKSGEYLLYMRIVGDQLVPRVFTPAQTAGLRTELQAIADAIVGV